MDTMERLAAAGIVPVVVLEKAGSAVPTAKALLRGGIDVMEITFRTAAAEESIRAVAQECPDMLVGAGTVITLEQCRRAVNAGAQFIVSPGFDAEVVSWCVENNVAVTPGCVTPSEIMAAMKYGLRVLKFFPAGVYGGYDAMKALTGPFPGIKFIPTGGVNLQNLSQYAAAPFVQAVGGSWVCQKADIQAENYEKISSLCAEARSLLLGFEVAHVGINTESAEESMALCGTLQQLFGFAVRPGNSSNFSTDAIEVMKSKFPGAHGHIAIRTNSIPRAAAELARHGFKLDMDTAKYKGERIAAVYLKNEVGGFALHLMQK